MSRDVAYGQRRLGFECVEFWLRGIGPASKSVTANAIDRKIARVLRVMVRGQAVTVRDVARLLKVHAESVRHWIRAGVESGVIECVLKGKKNVQAMYCRK